MPKARVHPADETDAEGARPLLAGLDRVFARLELVRVDGGDKRAFAEWSGEELGRRVEAVQHPDAGLRHVWLPAGAPPPAPRPRGVRVLPRRWAVERTFAWLGRSRRLSRDDEALPATEERGIDPAMSRLMLRRLTR